KHIAGIIFVLMFALPMHAAIKIVADHNPSELAASGFKFKNIPSPSQDDAAAKAKFTLVDGIRDSNGGNIEKLHDDKIPVEDDQPGENFFFQAGTDGGRILLDLSRPINIKQINSYSWHPNTRGPQVYKLYASTGSADDFNPQPKKGTDPLTCGWKLLASVDTRPKAGQGGGQYGNSLSDTDGTIGKYRYLLFDIFRTEATDPFGNTFFSEIDVIDADAPAVTAIPDTQPVLQLRRETVEADGGK
ncbi:unnamed protein product, partial [marine sediment metagenome]